MAEENETFDFACPFCGHQFKAHNLDSCPNCKKEIPEEYYSFDYVKDTMTHFYYCCARGLFETEEAFLRWSKGHPKKVGERSYSVDGLTYEYDENGRIIEVVFDFANHDPKILDSVFEDNDIYGIMTHEQYQIYKIMFDALKNIKSADDIYLIKNKGVSYYAFYERNGDFPYFENDIRAIATNKVPSNIGPKEIKEMILSQADRYEMLIWGDDFFGVTVDEIVDTMSYFKDSNKLSF